MDLRDELIAAAREACKSAVPFDPVTVIVDAILEHPTIVAIRDQAAAYRVESQTNETD